ncbi:MAG: BatD family protein, partial [Lentisphaeraceae bacterium]|nr:BatD family protein [Lentisphaeraceae bacterium]
MKYLFVLSIFCIQLLNGQTVQPLVKTKISEMSERWVGQRVPFYVELYSPSWFAGTPRFEIPEMKNAIVYKESGSPAQATVEIDGNNYSKQSYSFSIFTQEPGKITIPSFTVDFQVAVPGKKPQKISLRSEPISVKTLLPKVLKGKAFVTTSSFKVNETWSKRL